VNSAERIWSLSVVASIFETAIKSLTIFVLLVHNAFVASIMAAGALLVLKDRNFEVQTRTRPLDITYMHFWRFYIFGGNVWRKTLEASLPALLMVGE